MNRETAPVVVLVAGLTFLACALLIQPYFHEVNAVRLEASQ